MREVKCQPRHSSSHGGTTAGLRLEATLRRWVAGFVARSGSDTCAGLRYRVRVRGCPDLSCRRCDPPDERPTGTRRGRADVAQTWSRRSVAETAYGQRSLTPMRPVIVPATGRLEALEDLPTVAIRSSLASAIPVVIFSFLAATVLFGQSGPTDPSRSRWPPSARSGPPCAPRRPAAATAQHPRR